MFYLHVINWKNMKYVFNQNYQQVMSKQSVKLAKISLAF